MNHLVTLPTSIIGVTLLATLATMSLAADAQNRKGPRASVDVVTVCALNKANATFDVELRVSDKTSGSATPIVTAYSISALAKTQTGNWESQEAFAVINKSGLTQAVPATIKESFSLCSGGAINEIVGRSKGLNAMATTTYMADETGESRTVMNMCSDDPATLDVIEPAGIKLTGNDLNDISNACLP